MHDQGADEIAEPGAPVDFRTVLDGVAEAVLVCDGAGRLSYLNEAARAVLGEGEWVGRSLRDLLPQARTFHAACEAAARQRAPTECGVCLAACQAPLAARIIPLPAGGLAIFLRGPRGEADRVAEILESIGEAFYAVDESWRFTYVNRQAERLWGRRREHLLGRAIWKEFPEAVGGPSFQAHQRALATGDPVHLELVSAVTGRWFDVSIHPAAGGLSVYFRDIDDRKRAEHELRERTEVLRTITDHAADALFLTDADGCVTFMNPAAERMFGWTLEELRGRSLHDVVHHHHPDGHLFPAAECPLARPGPPGHVQSGEFVFFHRNGSQVPVACTNVAFAAEGRIAGTVQVARDISARKKVEQALRDSEARLRLATEAANIGTWDHDLLRNEMRWSDRCKALFGLAPETEAAYDTFLETVHPDDRERVRLMLRRALDPGSGGEIKLEFRTIGPHDRVERWIVARGRAIHENGRAVRLIGVVIDITGRKRAEAERQRFAAMLERRVWERTRELAEANARLSQEIAERERAEKALMQAQRMEAIGQLTGGVAHDFNNLLTAVIGNLELMERRVTDQGLRRHLQAAMRAARRGGELTHQLLAYARKQELSPRAVDVNAVISGMDDLLRRSLGGLVAIETDLAANPWPALSDPTQLELIVLNLAINARDAMPEGGRLRIATRTLAPDDPDLPKELLPGEYVMVRVADTGTGMSPEVMERAFEPFFTTKEVGKGSGLGLAQVYGVVRQFGGTVRLRSVPGEGTTVDLILPRAETMPAPSETSRDAGASAPARAAAILILDDDEEVRGIAAALLDEAGYQVLEAGSAPEALALLEQGEVSLALVDYAMPGMPGSEFVRRARALRPEMPVVYVTGYADPLPPGAEAPVLAKPYAQADLLAAVRRALQPQAA